MNTMVLISPLVIELLRECVSFNHVSTVKTVVISRHRVNFIVIICPGNSCARRYRKARGAETHTPHTDRRSIIIIT